MARLTLILLASALGACAGTRVPSTALERVRHPAFISRIQEGAGPRSRVFGEDGSYAPKLKQLDPREADRRLAAKLTSALTRFELSERLRVGVQGQLPADGPWTHPVPATDVAGVLQSFLVEEVPAHQPDYALLRPLGADAVVEFVVEEYGMRSKDGRAGVFVRGYGRMFHLDGGEVWRRPFALDGVAEGEDMDPLWVAREPQRYRAALIALLDRVAAQFAADLTPHDRRPSDTRQPSGGTPSLGAPPDDAERSTPREPPPPPPLPPGELPEPDAPEPAAAAPQP